MVLALGRHVGGGVEWWMALLWSGSMGKCEGQLEKKQ